MRTTELNGSFYSLQRPERYRGWRDAVPGGLRVLSVKGGRFITHMKQLRGVETALANFLASGALALGPTLGPMLWQLPPRLAFDPTGSPRSSRYCLDRPARRTRPVSGRTSRRSDFVYVRLHGDTELYTSGYTDAALREWAGKIRRWSRDRDVYVYFDNDVKAHAPRDAMTLADLLGAGPQ